MSWHGLHKDLWVNLNRFAFYDVLEDGTAVLTTPLASVLYLTEEHRQAIERLWKTRMATDHTVPGLAYPENSQGYWITTGWGAINMALADAVEEHGENRTIVRAGARSRECLNEDSILVRRWIRRKHSGAIL